MTSVVTAHSLEHFDNIADATVTQPTPDHEYHGHLFQSA